MSAPKPGTPEWRSLVTASKVAAILGLSPWESPYAMWHLMAGNLPPADESRPMKRGNMLENAVLDWWLDEHPDVTETARQQWYPLEDWAGATPDMDVTDPDGAHALVDAKTIGRDDDWTDEPPAYYIASSMWQLACAPTAQRVHLAVLFGRPFDLRTYTVERDNELIASTVARCRAFYDTLPEGIEPDLDDSVATYEAVRKIHPDIDHDAEVDLPHDLAHEYVTASLAKKEAENRERLAKARVLDVMERARIAKCNGVKIARRQARGDAVSLTRTANHVELPGVTA